MDNQTAFENGAKSMQSRIVAFLATKGHMDIAPQVLALDPPPYSEPEVWGIQTTSEREKEKGD